MPSSYSTNLKIELQATGENSGTWGNITNTNLGTALEQAIVGYGNPSYPSDANLTLTYTDTNAAQAARALVLNVTSAVSLSATRELVVPTIQKQYIVQNNTSGSQSITVKTSAGTGITVPNGRKAHLYVDGTNVIYMDDYVDINGGAIDGTPIGANSAAAGTFTTVGATTGNITTVNATTVDATNVEVTNIKAKDGTAAASIADSTGIISVTSNPTLSGGTANGVLYLNASKVATSGSALVFDGTNLGIGTSSPAYKLQVSTNANADATINASNTTDGTSSVARFLAISNAGSVWFGMTAPSYNAVTGASDACLINTGNASNGICFANDGVLQMKLDSSGNLGIGTASPATRLSVDNTRSDTAGTGWFTYTNAAVTTGRRGMRVDINNGYWFDYYNGSTWSAQMGLDSSGNLGIGVTPATWSITALQLKNGSLSGGTPDTYLSSNANFTSGVWKYIASTNATQFYQNAAGGEFVWRTAASGTAGNTISFTQAMTLDSSGNLGLGVTSPISRLDIRNTGGTYDKGISLQTSSGGNIATFWTTNNDLNIGIAGAHKFTNYDGSATRMTLDSSGNLGLGVTPSAWGSGYKAFQTSYLNFASATAGTGDGSITWNAYNNGTNWIYQYTGGVSTRYRQNESGHAWFYAASGTINTAVSFTQAMTLDASGNLGVGTTSPYARFQAYQSSSTLPAAWIYRGTQGSDTNLPTTFGYPYLQIGAVEYRTNSIQTIGFGYVSTNGNFPPAEIGLQTTSTGGETYGDLVFATRSVTTNTAATERARITSGGNLLVNTTTSYGRITAQTVDGSAAIGTIVSTAVNYNALDFRNSAGTQCGRILVNNAVTTEYLSASDRRLKENIAPADDAGSVIDSIEVVKHDWKVGGHVRFGVIAQDLHVVAPEAVGTGDTDDVEELKQPWGVDYSKLVPMLIKEVQSLRKRVAELEAK